MPTYFLKCFPMVYCSFSESLGITRNRTTAPAVHLWASVASPRPRARSRGRTALCGEKVPLQSMETPLLLLALFLAQ